MAVRTLESPAPPTLLEAEWLGGRKHAWLCLARQLDRDLAEWKTVVLLLDAAGRSVGGTSPEDGLRAAIPSGIARAGPGKALIASPRFRARDDSVLATQVEAVEWYVAGWSKRDLTLTRGVEWPEVDIGIRLFGTATTSTESLWVGTHFPPPLVRGRDIREGRIVVGRASGTSVRPPLKTDHLATDVSRPIAHGGAIYFATVPDYERVELWRWSGRGDPERRRVLHRRRNRKQLLGPACLALCRDRLNAVWGCYTDRVGAEKPRTWEGLLYACEVDLDREEYGEPFLATPDDRVVATTVQLHARRDGALATWESRPKRGGGGMRLQRVDATNAAAPPSRLEAGSVRVFAAPESPALLSETYDVGSDSWILSSDVDALAGPM